MKTIPIGLYDHLQQAGRSTCFLIKLVSQTDGTVYPFTTLDAAMKFDDGYHDLWYMPRNTLSPQNMKWSSKMDVDNSELHGWFDDTVATAATAGLLDSAEVTIYRVCYTKPHLGAEVVGFGIAGRMAFTAKTQGKRKIGFKGLDHLLKIKKNPLYSITCRNDFGDERCGLPFVWDPGSIAEVHNQFLMVRCVDVAGAAGTFDFGVVRFTSGDNAGVEMEVERWGTDGWMRLSFVTPYPMQVGDTLSLRQDCNKFAQTCILKGNIVNFNGEHLCPVQDQSLMVPGAYIKTNNAL